MMGRTGRRMGTLRPPAVTHPPPVGRACAARPLNGGARSRHEARGGLAGGASYTYLPLLSDGR